MGSLSGVSTYRAAQSVQRVGRVIFRIFLFFFPSLFPLHMRPLLLVVLSLSLFFYLARSLAHFPVLHPLLSLACFSELTVGRAHLACNFQNVE